ncbi:glycoside hydrolase family 27 protein [Croceibacterium sp. TMG7-5b_MA50]|uniref:glycoside hydrolase family 27 protein n=1 Tax=Croceibacterium sp. TMG7-5b_MA50 TaxID=3121290 RepID=UPI003221EAAB
MAMTSMTTGAQVPAAAATLAPTPPMGWNSWNSFATTITEEQALETARIMADKLLPAGYDVFTVDIQWYEPDARSYTYNARPQPAMDRWGRLQPAPNRFPSAADGSGFARLAEQVHALGLRFGIHVMRGIPRAAVMQNLPVFGSSGVRAAEIADTSSICSWNPDMYGVAMGRPGAQDWYDGIFRQYAEWGVDFIKMDDMSRPYDAHAAEIEAAHRAIDRAGRPIVLSLSPGETPVTRADHVRRHAQMWRISDDFWDDWGMLEAQFTRLENWHPHVAPGSWPDADMLPLGRLALGERDTRFTPAEQRTLMTLWAIARSPLIMGGDLRHLDDATLALLTNPAVIALNQSSHDNRPHFLKDGLRVWTARSADGVHAWLAVFNLDKEPQDLSVALTDVGLSAAKSATDIWASTALPIAEGRLGKRVEPHGALLLRLV